MEPPVKLAVVGSTGRTGREVVHQALARGHHVLAWARTPDKLAVDHPQLSTIQVDVLTSDLQPALQDVDAVIVCLGGAQLKDSSTRSQGTQRIVQAMIEHKVPRIVVVSSAGVGDSINQLDEQGKHVVQNIIKEAVEDHGRQEAIVQQSDLQWTILRPGGLSNEALSPYNVDASGQQQIGRIPRASVADLALRSLENSDSVGKIYTLHSN